MVLRTPKKVVNVIKPIHQTLKEKIIDSLEKESESSKKSVKDINAEANTTTKQMPSTGETKIRVLETLKTVITKQQAKIANDDKNTRLRNVVITGVNESEPLYRPWSDVAIKAW